MSGAPILFQGQHQLNAALGALLVVLIIAVVATGSAFAIVGPDTAGLAAQEVSSILPSHFERRLRVVVHPHRTVGPRPGNSGLPDSSVQWLGEPRPIPQGRRVLDI